MGAAETYIVGQVVALDWTVLDENGDPVAPSSATLTITLPDGSTSTPTLSNPDTGQYTYDFVCSTTGAHSALFETTGTDTTGAAQESWVVIAAAASTAVTLAVVTAYLGDDLTATSAQISGALEAERAAQARMCKIDAYGPDLAEALKRRVARNLAARNVPVAQFGEGIVPRVTTTDPEIERLEGPYRKWAVR